MGIDADVPVADGGALVVTTRLGAEDEGFMSHALAAVVEEAGLDRAARRSRDGAAAANVRRGVPSGPRRRDAVAAPVT